MFPAILADVCYIQSLRYLDASTVSIILPFQFAAAALLAFLFLGERLDGLQLLGGGLVLAGILRVQRKEHRIAHRMKNRTD